MLQEDRTDLRANLMERSQNPIAADTLEALGSLDDTIHQKVRLGIMSTLLALGESDFKLLKETLSLSDGNLSTHLALLEERGYLEAHKEFVRRKPHTTYKPTDAGRDAFYRYLSALERIIRAAEPLGTHDSKQHGRPESETHNSSDSR